jgi:hypothetical protein
MISFATNEAAQFFDLCVHVFNVSELLVLFIVVVLGHLQSLDARSVVLHLRLARLFESILLRLQ